MDIVEDFVDKLNDKNNFVWSNQVNLPTIIRWLENFDSDEERKLALNLLLQFTYYKNLEIKSLLRSAFNLYCHETQFTLEVERSGVLDIKEHIKETTRFYGMLKNPSKSGTFLLRPFRNANKLESFMFPEEDLKEVPKEIKNVVLIDDILSSGDQVITHWKKILQKITENNKHVVFHYLVLFGLTNGISRIKKETTLNLIVVNELDDSQKVFSDESGYFKESEDNEKKEAMKMCVKHGNRIYSDVTPLGYGDSQLLLGFEHGIPDNTLPIIWSTKGWFPIFTGDN